MKSILEFLEGRSPIGVAPLLACLAAGLMLVGCATKYPPAPREAQTADYEYIIGPGDSSISSCGAIRNCR